MAVYFLDNDVILKLSAYNLFWDCMKAWGILDAQIRVLPTAEAVFSRKQAVRDQYSDQTRQKARQIAQNGQKLSSPDSILNYSILNYQRLQAVVEELRAATGNLLARR